MNTLMIAAIVVGVLVIVVIVRFLPARKGWRGRAEEFTMTAAWERYAASAAKGSPRDREARQVLEEHPELSDSCRRDLLDLERRFSIEPFPLRSYRAAIMDATDQYMFNEGLGTEEATLERAEAVVKVGVLRTYTRYRHGDFAERDWFSHYRVISEMNVKNVVGMIEKTTSGESAQLESALHGHLSGKMEEARAALLEYPVATPVLKEQDLSKPEDRRQSPSKKQVERLSALMKDRFEKLFSGQLYHWLDGPSVNPSKALALESGLLYTLVSIQYPESREAWKSVLETSLGGQWSQMLDLSTLESYGGRCREIWMKNQADGPLTAVLREAAQEVYQNGSGTADSNQFKPDAMALQMSCDSMVLVREVESILRDY